MNYKNYNLTFTLIIINIIIFIVSALILPKLNKYIGLNPYRFINMKYYWTSVTHMFAHADFNHLFFNMLMLFILGPALERSIGSGKFIVYYLVTGTLAGIFSLIFYTVFSLDVNLVGASGAIYSILFAYAVIYPNRKIYIFGIIPITPPALVTVFIIYNLYSQIFRNTNVAHITHLSGFLFAYLYFRIIFKIDPVYVFKNYKRFR